MLPDVIGASPTDRRLSRSRLADQPHDLALGHGEAHAVDRREALPPGAPVLHDEVRHLERDRLRLLRRGPFGDLV
jgi:hypothetical protein